MRARNGARARRLRAWWRREYARLMLAARRSYAQTGRLDTKEELALQEFCRTASLYVVVRPYDLPEPYKVVSRWRRNDDYATSTWSEPLRRAQGASA